MAKGAEAGTNLVTAVTKLILANHSFVMVMACDRVFIPLSSTAVMKLYVFTTLPNFKTNLFFTL